MTGGPWPEVRFGEWFEKYGRDLSTPLELEGITVEPLYTAKHPHRRGDVVPTSAPSWRPPQWLVCQGYPMGDPRQLNRWLRADFDKGVTMAHLHCSRAVGQWKSGDLATALEGLDGQWRGLMVDTGGALQPAIDALDIWFESSRIDPGNRLLALAADPLNLPGDPGSAAEDVHRFERDLAGLLRQRRAWHGLRPLVASGRALCESGAEADQELGIALALGVHYLRFLEKRGVEPAEAASRLVFEVSIGPRIFLEVAKLRALRALWELVLRGCRVSPAPPVWLHASVLQRSLPAVDPPADLLRVTHASWVAAVGGADSLETALRSDTESGGRSERYCRWMRNVQHVLQLEAHLGVVADPARGSYALESMTEALMDAGWTRFQEIESRGGILAAWHSGWLGAEIAERERRRREGVESGEIPVLGVNRFRQSAAEDSM